MKKYFALLVILVILGLLANKSSYAYVDCSNVLIEPTEINTNNLKNYITSTYPNKSLNYICSYSFCYNVKSGDINSTINDFKTLLSMNSNYEVNQIAYVKGYAITKISINNCI